MGALFAKYLFRGMGVAAITASGRTDDNGDEQQGKNSGKQR
jgi:hypothetical protein